MIKKIQFLGYLTLILFSYQSVKSQTTIVNKEWDSTTGNVGAINRTVSAVDNNENIIVVSNTMITSTNSEVLITKYDPDGIILWQETFNGGNSGYDYAIQLKIDNNNNIFIAAALENTTMDFGVLKYDAGGTLIWSNSWNGSANARDIPADIGIDNNENIYLVGGSEAANGFSDYAVVKFNSSGTFVWETTYDYANLHDAASGLVIDNSNIIVIGASASALTEWDYATHQIDLATGNINLTERTIIAGVGLDNAQAVTADLNNNIYITGYVEINGNTNIQTVKIDGNFGLVWVENFDGGLEDVGESIGVDNFGNVYITGYTENATGGTEYITIKYDSQGTELWNKKYGNVDNSVAKAKSVVVIGNGDIIVTGTVQKNGTKNFSTIKYDTNGNIKFAKEYDAANDNDEAESVVIYNNSIYVTGTS